MKAHLPHSHMKGSLSMKIGSLDLAKILTVAFYVGFSAFLASMAQFITGADFSTVSFLGVNGQMIAVGVVNTMLYMAERIARNTE